MALFKCKMCGGELNVTEGATVIECEYCLTKQTLPKLTDDRKASLYDRAGHFRRNNDFDKAIGVYELILNEDNTDAEAYWSLVLCRYGVEYVEDPATKRRIPTVNRAQYTSIYDDEDYKAAIKYADSYQRQIYEAEAREINEIQKGILAISQKEEPFDIFICYKETDASGKRTQDSVLAQDLYFQLKNEGYKVFFSRITLEDKLGSAYEPYIFAALNSAKVMVVLGTKPEHFNAVWVKNEWSRYLALVKKGGNRMLIPAYRDMDPYNLPEEFSHLQAQDMSKLGFMQDLVRGIKKIIGEEPQPTARAQSFSDDSPSSIAPLIERAFMFLEDGDFARANETLEKILDRDPKNAQAYLGKLMCDTGSKSKGMIVNSPKEISANANYQKAFKFGDDELKKDLSNLAEANYVAIYEPKYQKAVADYSKAQGRLELEHAMYELKKLGNYRDAEAYRQECMNKINNTPFFGTGVIPTINGSSQKRDSNEALKQKEAEYLAMTSGMDELQYRQHVENITAQYNSIPSEERIKEEVKKDPKIKRLLIIAIVFVFVYWPVGAILFFVRYIQIKKAVEAENTKYAALRREYARLMSGTR